MAVRSIQRVTNPTEIRPFFPDAIDVGFDVADSDLLKYKDSAAATRTVVTTDNTQTLTNKTLTSPTITGAISTPAVTALAADGAIPIISGTYKITKAGVCALTLAAPTAPQEGTRLFITSQTANAHTITATGLFEDGGGTEDLATFANVIGAGIVLVAINLKWHTEGTPINVTLS